MSVSTGGSVVGIGCEVFDAHRRAEVMFSLSVVGGGAPLRYWTLPARKSSPLAALTQRVTH